MTTLAINLTTVEFIVLSAVALIFGLALYFFLKSRKNLLETVEASNRYQLTLPKKESLPKTTLTPLEEQWNRQRQEALRKQTVAATPPPVRKQAPAADEHLAQDLKQTIAQQQKLLNKYLGTIEEMETVGRESLKKENQHLQNEISELQEQLKEKDAEVQDLYQQAASAQKMAARIEEVYREFDQLQAKMQQLEKQAGRANSLAIELEDTRNAYEALHKELSRKQDKLEEMMEDNQNMKEEINLLEDKLSESNLQRQQLQKKVQFLTDLNNDMQGISDTNKKLQTELRRIGELESMLNMMAEERDYLLRRKLEK